MLFLCPCPQWHSGEQHRIRVDVGGHGSHLFLLRPSPALPQSSTDPRREEGRHRQCGHGPREWYRSSSGGRRVPGDVRYQTLIVCLLVFVAVIEIRPSFVAVLVNVSCLSGTFACLVSCPIEALFCFVSFVLICICFKINNSIFVISFVLLLKYFIISLICN